MKTHDIIRNHASPFLVAAMWGGVVLLVMIGLASALGRSIFPSDLATRMEPFRQDILDALHREDPFSLQRADELNRFDRRFAAHPDVTLLHVLPGSIFLILAPFQFSSRIRRRHIQFHRWSGRLLMVAAVVSTFAGFYFGLLMPYAGLGEATAITVFGGLLLTAVIKAFVAIRTHHVAAHREWMIRAFAVAASISSVRVIAAILDFALTPAGVAPRAIFALSLWIGWGLTVGAAELWLIYTRQGVPSAVVPVGAT